MANFCSECGSQIATGVKFCAECGTALTATALVATPSSAAPVSSPASSASVSAPPNAVHVVVHEEGHELACPSCHKVDSVQKVSTVVSQGGSAISLSGGFSSTAVSRHSMSIKPHLEPYTLERRLDLNGRSTTTTSGSIDLSGGQWTYQSTLLAPPAAPEYASPWKGIVGTLILGSIGILIGIVIVGAILPKSAFVGIVSLLVLFGWPLYHLWSTHQQAQAAKAAYESAVPRYQEATRRWDRLYYCFRCDGAFVPGLSQLIPASGVTDFLFA
jgi:hypothetical protein